MSILIQDRDFGGITRAAELALEHGENMRGWWDTIPPITLMDLPGSRPEARLYSFFCTLPIDGVPTAANGCFQTSTFARKASPGQPAVSLTEWVGGNFLQQARYTNKNGTRGGILYRPIMVLERGATEVRRVDEDLELKVNEIGTRYEWAAMRLDLLDYMRAFPVIGGFDRILRPLNREAGYVVLHPSFLRTQHPLPAGCVEECSFAYSVAPWKVMSTMAAYGPGRFHSAYKQFRFYLMADGSVAIEVLFLVAPRCPKVLTLLGFDPVFGTVRLLNALTLGQTNIVERSHHGVDRYAMGHHARIHHNVLFGMRSIWENTNWQPAQAK